MSKEHNENEVEVAEAMQESASTGRRGAKLVVLALVAIITLGLGSAALGVWYMVWMPGDSHVGELPPLTDGERQSAGHLQRNVAALSSDIGPRDVTTGNALDVAEKYLRNELARLGHDVEAQPVVADGVESHNLEVEIEGTSAPDEIIVIGAHYDTVPDTPGADDNASGTAVALDMLRRVGDRRFDRTVRFVFFTNEEPPWFKQSEMGSLVYANACRARGDDIVAMLSLETLGFYRDEPGTQHYPPPFSLLYPDTGNFIAFVGDMQSRDLLHEVIGTFRETTEFPSDGLAGPHAIPGVTFSDQWSFWVNDYPGLMVTDTAFNRNEHYHEATDTAEKLDYERMARVTTGLVHVLEHLADGDTDL